MDRSLLDKRIEGIKVKLLFFDWDEPYGPAWLNIDATKNEIKKVMNLVDGEWPYVAEAIAMSISGHH